MNASKPAFIFDFDGTIANTLTAIIQSVRDFAKKEGLGEISDQEIETLRNKTVKELLNFFHVPFYKLPFFVRSVRKTLSDRIKSAQPVPGIREVLDNLHQQNFILGILTTNSRENVMLFLKRNKLEIFDFVLSDNNIFGKDKVLNKIIQKYHLNKDQVYYIGDEVRDIEAAKKANFKSIAVSWGFNKEEILKKHSPDYLFNNPIELLSRRLLNP